MPNAGARSAAAGPRAPGAASRRGAPAGPASWVRSCRRWEMREYSIKMHTMRSLCRLAALAALMLLVSCAQPVPPARAAYVGDWRGEKMPPPITPGGQVPYFRPRGGPRPPGGKPLPAFAGADNLLGF